MKTTYSLMLVGVMALVPATRAVDRVVTTEAATGPGSLTEAINALNNGDRITFNISPGTPSAVHYIQIPPDGFPLITKSDITIDGYTQPGSSANTASIHAANNAALKIVICATNGNALSMYSAAVAACGCALPNFGYGDSEMAMLGFFDATNALVKGLCFIGSPFTASTQAPPNVTDPPINKGICFAANSQENGGAQCQNWRVSGCWFGVDPVTKTVAFCDDPLYGNVGLVATPGICITSYRTRNAVGGSEPTWNYNWPGTVGVPAKSANPRAEFNVLVCGDGFQSEGKDYRISGNFFDVLPDGVTRADMTLLSPLQRGTYVEIGRNNSNIIFGTDGDGVNDADEGNVCCGHEAANDRVTNIYSPNAGTGTNQVMAGNYFNANINGQPFGANLGTVFHTLKNTATLRFGNDFNGVSDSVKANLMFNMTLIDFDTSWSTNLYWVSLRGNAMTNCISQFNSTPPLGDGQGGSPSGLNTYGQFIDASGPNGTLDFIPVVTSASATTLSGTCGKPLYAPYNTVIIDLYYSDPSVPTIPEGKQWITSFTDNSAADANPAVGAFTFNTSGLGLSSGKQITITASYLNAVPATIKSITRNGNSTTIKINNPNGGNYGIFAATTVNGTYLPVAATDATGEATFTSSNAAVFYRVTTPLGQGQTSPFSLNYTIP